MSTGSTIPPVLRQLLARVERRRRSLAVLRGMAIALSVAVTGVLLLALYDRVALPDIALRGRLSLAVYLCAGLCLAVLGLRHLLRRLDDAAIARRIEARNLVPDEGLSAAVELARQSDAGVSSWMIDRTIALAASSAARVEPAEAEPSAAVRRRAYVAGALVLVVVIGMAVPTTRVFLLRAAVPGLDLARPSAIALQVAPSGTVRLARGSDLRITAYAESSTLPTQASLLVVWDDGLEERLPMVVDADGRFVRSLRGMTQACRFRVQAGDAESAASRVMIDEPPRVEAVQLRVQPPGYTGLGLREEDAGDAEVPFGSRVTVTATLSGAAVRSAHLVTDAGLELPMQLVQGRAVVDWQLEDSVTYGMRLVSADGLSVEPVERWRLTVHADAAPQVELVVATTSVTAAESVIMGLTAQDDLGLRTVQLVWEAPDGGRGAIPVSAQGLDETQLEGSAVLDLSRFELGTGDRVTVFAEAIDRGGQRSLSEQLELLITSADVAASAEALTHLRAQLKALTHQRKRMEKLRGAWSEMRLGYRLEDHALHRGTILVQRSTLDEVARAMAQIAKVMDGLYGAELVEAHAPGIAGACREWDEADRQVLARALDPLDTHTPPADVDQRIAQISYDVNRAVSNLGEIESWLRLLEAATDAELLHGRSAAAGARLDRSLTLLQAWRAWVEPDSAPGLQRAIFRGLEPAGTPVHQDVALPAVRDGQQPVVGGENYAMRWVGEIRLPGPGWTFVGKVDDGLQVRIGSQDLFAKTAWIGQAPTEYRVAIDAGLSGWQPISIDYFQATGGAFLACWFERDDKRVKVDRSNLRHRIEAPGTQLMTRIGPEQIDRAVRASLRDLEDVQGVPQRVERIASHAPAPKLNGRVRDVRPQAKLLAGFNQSALDELDRSQLSGLAAGVSAVIDLAAEADRYLRQLLAKRGRDWARPLGEAERLARRSKDLREELEQLRRDKAKAASPNERTAALGDQLTQMANQLAAMEASASARARDPAVGSAERLLSLDAAASVREALHRTLPKAFAQIATDTDADYDEAVKTMRVLEKELEALAKTEGRLRAAVLTDAAAEVLVSERLHDASAGDGAAADLAKHQRDLARAELAQQARDVGAYDLVHDLTKLGPEPLDSSMRRRLNRIADMDRSALAETDTRFDDDLKQTSQDWSELGADPVNTGTLADMPLRMDAGVAKLRNRGADEQAAQLAALSEEVRALDPNTVTPEKLTALTDRASELARRDADADTVAQAPDSNLDELAAGLAGKDDVERAAALSELQRLAAGDSAERLRRADQALALAERLEALDQALRQAESEERAAVAAFAAAEDSVAARMAALAATPPPKAPDALGTAMTQAHQALPEQLAAARDLVDSARATSEHGEMSKQAMSAPVADVGPRDLPAALAAAAQAVA
ncbi:MAG: hypothetical protein PF961_12840, partial [Planctomycetota bacterium]|nr:hypothetical protein [Planctomycetota bacterium]